jgi:hypothetical protein
MASNKITLPDDYDPYDMRLKVQFNPNADRINFVANGKGNPKLCCGAMRNGEPCKKSAGAGTSHLGYGRCKLHGGCSTGPKTEEGKAKSINNNIKHGLYAKTLLPEELETLKEIEEAPDFDPLDYAIKVQVVKIISYLQKHSYRFGKDRELEGEEMAYRKSRVICREGDGVKSFYHAGTIEDNALDRALNTLRRFLKDKAVIDGKDDSEDSILDAINAELRAASKGQVSISWGGNAQLNQVTNDENNE